LNCEVIDEKPNNQYILSVSEISIASKERSLNRIVPPEGAVWITNIRTSKTTIDANLEPVSKLFVLLTRNYLLVKWTNIIQRYRMDFGNK
ncbi:PF07614 domain protein, partial [Leptospira noguchii str. 2001034031]